MEHRITASRLARQLADVLNRVRYRGDTFVVERQQVAVARIEPTAAVPPALLGDAIRAWMVGGGGDSAFAYDLACVNAADRAPRNQWDS